MGKTVLITGASAGFGEACARKYAEPQTRLILAARRLERLEALQQELRGTESSPSAAGCPQPQCCCRNALQPAGTFSGGGHPDKQRRVGPGP